MGEVLIGYRVDRDVGPLVMVAAGGILAEIYRDRSLRLAPVDLADRARDDRRGARRSSMLAGYRGQPPGDLDALARALVALSQLACRRSRGRRGRDQSADRAAGRPGRRRRRCAGEACVRGRDPTLPSYDDIVGVGGFSLCLSLSRRGVSGVVVGGGGGVAGGIYTISWGGGGGGWGNLVEGAPPGGFVISSCCAGRAAPRGGVQPFFGDALLGGWSPRAGWREMRAC